MVLAKLPDTPAFKRWWNNMLETVASCFIDPHAALVWAKQCENRPVDDAAIDNPQSFYRGLDAKWSKALSDIVSGTVAADITLYQEKVMQGSALMSARRKAVIIWDHYQTSANRGGMYSHENLTACVLVGQDLLGFSKRWREVNQGLKIEISDDIKQGLLYKQLSRYTKLDFDLQIYLRAEANKGLSLIHI